MGSTAEPMEERKGGLRELMAETLEITGLGSVEGRQTEKRGRALGCV